MNIKKIVMSLSLGALVGIISIFPSFAETLPTVTFESYALGTVSGQDGWSGAVNPSYDQEVIDVSGYDASFGTKALRVSDAVTSGSFGDWIFVKPLTDSVGEADATANGFSEGIRQTHFEMEFDLASIQALLQPGLHVSVSPDRGDGSRMSYLRFEDQADGIHVFFDDVTNPGGIGTVSDFNETDIATISRTPHRIKLTMDTLDGPGNDVVKVYIDGALEHEGTSWEDYYRYDPEAIAEQSPRIVKTMIIQARGGANPGNLGKGFLFDNISLSSSSEVAPSISPTVTPTATLTPTPNPLLPEACSGIDIDGEVIIGSGKSEKLNGTNKNDLILGKGGSDVIHGNGGEDCIVGGSGSDVLYGDNGNDVVLGEGGSDSMYGGNGKDTLIGGGGWDSARGENGQDTCDAESKASCEL